LAIGIGGAYEAVYVLLSNVPVICSRKDARTVDEEKIGDHPPLAKIRLISGV